MNIEHTEFWISVVANLGVIIGLILVAVQIKQNTDITKAQITNDYFLADMELELKMMGDNPVTAYTKAIYRPDELNEEDRAIMDRYYNFGLVQIQRLEEMRKYGLAEKDLTERLAYLSWHLGNEPGRRWWNGIKYYLEYDPDFVKMVDRILDTEKKDQNRVTLDTMLPPKPTPNG